MSVVQKRCLLSVSVGVIVVRLCAAALLLMCRGLSDSSGGTEIDRGGGSTARVALSQAIRSSLRFYTSLSFMLLWIYSIRTQLH